MWVAAAILAAAFVLPKLSKPASSTSSTAKQTDGGSLDLGKTFAGIGDMFKGFTSYQAGSQDQRKQSSAYQGADLSEEATVDQSFPMDTSETTSGANDTDGEVTAEDL